jgi:thiol-disulfide isomerase/thioredoxin
MKPTRIFVAVLLLLTGGPALPAATPTSPALEFQDRQGHPHTLQELHGHPAVINFWATWCGPCREEMPRLQKISESYAARQVQFIAISLDAPDTRSKIESVIAKRGLRFPVWTGASDATLSSLELGVLVPATLILDADGQVIGKIEGEAREKDLRARLDWALNGHQGKQPKVVQKNDW